MFKNLDKCYLRHLIDIDKENNGIYKTIIDIIKTEFLGPNSAKFEEHCKGLRVQCNSFLLHPDIKRILCDENTIDI